MLLNLFLVWLILSLLRIPYRLPYSGYFGGVSGLSKTQFLKINGFPNEYWGWGGEDDDIFNRYVRDFIWVKLIQYLFSVGWWHKLYNPFFHIASTAALSNLSSSVNWWWRGGGKEGDGFLHAPVLHMQLHAHARMHVHSPTASMVQFQTGCSLAQSRALGVDIHRIFGLASILLLDRMVLQIATNVMCTELSIITFLSFINPWKPGMWWGRIEKV